MKIFEENEKEISEINMIPLVDIVLVILIIFMATATFMVEGKIPLDLPKAKTGEPSKQLQKRIEITIKKDGIYSFFNNVSHNRVNKDLKIREYDYEYLKDICNFTVEEVELERVDRPELQGPNGVYYWPEDEKIFYCPTITLK